jgi:galactose mutarotase-like enzyme
MGGFETLSFVRSGASFDVVPARGGIVTRYAVEGRDVLYLDPATLADPTKNVRGGIPVLFPSPGKLAPGSYHMNQHGFARELPWEVAGEGEGSVSLQLVSSEATRALFPFDFRLAFTITLEGTTLAIRQRYENLSKDPMPLHAGFHPYFLVPDAEKPATTISTKATRAFDNVTKKDIAFHGFDLAAREVDLHLHDHGEPRSVLARPGGRSVAIEASPEFTHWVVWTLAGKDFVCVEPWTAPANALNTGERLIWLAPDEARESWIAIRAL